MVKHIILWKLKTNYSEEEILDIKKNIKKHLESLRGVIPGLVDISVNINKLESSNMDLMLDSSFESYDALKKYSVNPSHVAIANEFVRPYTDIRSCLDYEI